MSVAFTSRAELARYLRRHVGAQLYDESGVVALGIAIYSLSDPRDLRQVRYVGQTRAPARRWLQHVNTAQLWWPDDTPWWMKAPKLRPLSGWIRELFKDGERLPVMVVGAWVALPQARAAERARIYECLGQRLPLLNVEIDILGPQVPLI